MSTIDHTSDPMADRWEALTQAIRAERDAHRKLRAERDAHRERAEHAEARVTDLPREISRDELQAMATRATAPPNGMGIALAAAAVNALPALLDAADKRPLAELARQINDNARAHGFWEVERNMGEMLMLAVSELSEALEEHRAGRPPVWYQHRQPCAVQSDGLPIPADELGPCSGAPVCKPEGVAVELADCLIRCLDTMHSLGVDIDAVVAEKMAYNAARPFKHGKTY